MAEQLDITMELGPQFTVQVLQDGSTKPMNLVVGAKTSGGSNGTSASATVDVTITTAISIGAYRAMTVDGIYTERNETSLSRYAGVSKYAVGLGELTSVVRSGLMTEANWAWTPDQPIFVGDDGVLTQTTTAIPIRRIGWAISETQINLDPYPIIGA